MPVTYNQLNRSIYSIIHTWHIMKHFKQSALATSLFIIANLTHAAAPVSHVQNPGFYHFNLGSYHITALSDGLSKLPVDKLLINGSLKNTLQLLTTNHSDNPTTTSVNAYLVNTGNKLVLFDTGSGAFMGNSLGKLSHALSESGYEPEQVDDIYITHLHPDHIGGLIHNNQPVFKNATLWIEKKEADYWLDKKNIAKEADINRPFFTQAIQAISPYIKIGKVKFYSQTHLDNGISVLDSGGHTPGHVFYKITSDGKSLFIVGDLLHVGDVQMANPTVGIRFDTSPKEATKTRLNYFQRFAGEGDAIAAAHLPFPGVGYIMKENIGYRWKPINYGADIK